MLPAKADYRQVDSVELFPAYAINSSPPDVKTIFHNPYCAFSQGFFFLYLKDEESSTLKGKKYAIPAAGVKLVKFLKEEE